MTPTVGSPQNGYCHRFAVNKSHEQAIITDASPTSQPRPQRGGPCLYVCMATLRHLLSSNFSAIINFNVHLACTSLWNNRRTRFIIQCSMGDFANNHWLGIVGVDRHCAINSCRPFREYRFNGTWNGGME